VEQILVNLLRNALRHTPPGGIVVVSLDAITEEICLCVCDTGDGIAREELSRIWDRFYRGADARARDAHGAGLGLSLVKELTEAMRGRVTVQSTPGQGACFRVWFPRASA
jgi:signal transduction histidine kinase